MESFLFVCLFLNPKQRTEQHWQKPVCIVKEKGLVTHEQNLMDVAFWWLITILQVY